MILKNLIPSSSCQPGDFYFTNKEHIIDYLYIGIYITEITIPNDAKVYKDPYYDIWKADKFIINKYCFIEQWNYWNDEKFCIESIKNNGCHLQYILKEFKTKELCELAVKKDIWALEFVPDEFITKELCELALKK